MKTHRSKMLILLALSVIYTGIYGQEAKNNYAENFDVVKGSKLIVDSDYSDVEILSWDQNNVDVLVEVEASASSKSKAENTLERVVVEIYKEGKNVVVKSGLKPSSSMRNVKLEIHVIIKAPAWMDISAATKYGDLFLQECNGLASLKVQYGNLKAGILGRKDAKPFSTLDLAYGNATIDELGWLELDIAYSDIEITRGLMLFVDNKYSNVIGEKISGIVTDGVYDKYVFDEIDSFVGDLKYSGLKFGQLNKNLSVDCSYTNISLKGLSPDFAKIDATLSYGNFKLQAPGGGSFKLKAESQYGNIKLGENLDDKDLSKMKQNSSTKVWGSIGSNPRSEVLVKTKYGNISIE